jgi:hypothetical protein
MDNLNFEPLPELKQKILKEGNERIFQAYGFECRAERMNTSYLGCINGYIKIPEGHPWYGLGDSDSLMWEVDVHGGITYGSPELHTPNGKLAGWWIGFDTAHAGDLLPIARGISTEADYYRDMDFVVSELTSLALQAKEAEDDTTSA